MKLWIDDVRPSPEGYKWVHSVNEAKWIISNYDDIIGSNDKIELIDIDHDAGVYSQFGGDYIKLLDWLEETKRVYPIKIHSMNPVGVKNMRNIIIKNNWIEIR